MVVDQNEIRAIRKVVKQLTAEILLQCKRASSHMQARIVMEEHYKSNECQYSKSFVLDSLTMNFQSFAINLMLYWSIVA
jgi:hypothetical protein